MIKNIRTKNLSIHDMKYDRNFRPGQEEHRSKSLDQNKAVS